MDVDSVSALLRQASSMSFVPGDLVFEEGGEGHSMYILTQGAFEVFRTSGGKHVRIAKVEPGRTAFSKHGPDAGQVPHHALRQRLAFLDAIHAGELGRGGTEVLGVVHRACRDDECFARVVGRSKRFLQNRKKGWQESGHWKGFFEMNL
jgi:hypothetical protein